MKISRRVPAACSPPPAARPPPPAAWPPAAWRGYRPPSAARREGVTHLSGGVSPPLSFSLTHTL